MASFSAWQLNDVVFSGTPFGSNATADSDDIGTTFTINAGARPKRIDLTDDEGHFHDGDSGQDLDGAQTFNGVSFASGDSIETEYAYVVRPVGGATDGSEDVRIYAVEIEGDVEGFVADGFLQAGETYEIIAIDSQDPTVAYSSLYVCFRSGTLIDTEQGPRAVEALVPGDRLWTLDHGFQPLRWAGRQRVPGTGAMAPIRFDVGVLGNTRPLFVSPQHRMLMQSGDGDVLVPAIALVDVPGVEQVALPQVDYVHLLMPGHEVLKAEGALAESFNPGPMAWQAMPDGDGQALGAREGDKRLYADARPVMGAGQWRRANPLAANPLGHGAGRGPARPV